MGKLDRKRSNTSTSAYDSESDSYYSEYSYDSSYESDSEFDSEDSELSNYQDSKLSKFFDKYEAEVKKRILENTKVIIKPLLKNARIKINSKKLKSKLTKFDSKLLTALGVEKKSQVKLAKERFSSALKAVLILCYCILKLKIRKSFDKAIELAMQIRDKCSVLDEDDVFRLKCTDLLGTKLIKRKQCFYVVHQIQGVKFTCYGYLVDSDDETQLDKLYKRFTSDNEAVEYELDKNLSLRPVFKELKYQGIKGLSNAKKLTHSKLIKLGVSDEDTRTGVITAVDPPEKYKKERIKSSDESFYWESDEEIAQKSVVTVEKVLRSADKTHFLPLFKQRGVRTLEEARKLAIRDFRQMKISKHEDRMELFTLFREFKVYNESVMQQLKDNQLFGYKEIFARFCSVDECRTLSKTDMKMMGVLNLQHREKLEEAFKWSSIRKASKRLIQLSGVKPVRPVERSLDVVKLLRYRDNFNDVRSLKQASKLSQSEMEKMGVSMFEDRYKLMRQFRKDLEFEKERRQRLKNSLK